MARQRNIDCVCRTEARKQRLGQTADGCVCTLISKTTKTQTDLGFPIKVNIVRDRGEFKRQQKKRGRK